MSYSPNRVRRNSIFAQRKPNKNMFKSAMLPSAPTTTELLILQNKLTTYFTQHIDSLVRQIEQNNKTIQILNSKLKQNQQYLYQKNIGTNQNRNRFQLIDELIEAQLNKRLNIVSKKFAQMQDAFVVNMFPTSQQPILELSPDPARNFLSTENDYHKLKVQMDDKLNQMIASSNASKDYINTKCWQIGEQIRISQQVIDSMNMGIENIRSKIFSLQGLLRTIQNRGQQFKAFTDNKMNELKQDFNNLNIQVLNLQNGLRAAGMKKQKQISSRLTQRSNVFKQKQSSNNNRYQSIMLEKQRQQKQKHKYKLYQSNKMITNIKDFRREILEKEQISQISSISSSTSFLPHPVFIPKVKTHPSLSSSPNSKILATTKVTTTFPLKPSKISNFKPFTQNSSDQFLDFYRQQSLELTKQIMSPFQQAQYISQNDQLDNTRTAFTVPLKILTQSSIQDVVKQTINKKNLKTPIPAYLDSNGYIKKANGAYLFDWRGDVLKCNIEQFKKMCNRKLFIQK